MVEELLTRLARGLERARIPYMVIGGQAVLVYGEVRLTKDIDITLGVDTSALDRVSALVSNLKLEVLVKDVKEFVKDTMVLPCADPGTGMRVDLIFSFSPYEQQAIGRAGRVTLGRARFRVASLEDVVIHKVIAGRPRDLEDVRAVLLRNPDYDRDYILDWLEQFDVTLQECFAEVFEELETDVTGAASKSRRRKD